MGMAAALPDAVTGMTESRHTQDTGALHMPMPHELSLCPGHMTCPHAQVTGIVHMTMPLGLKRASSLTFSCRLACFQAGRVMKRERASAVCITAGLCFSFYCYCLASIAFYKGRTLCLKTSEDLYG